MRLRVPNSLQEFDQDTEKESIRIRQSNPVCESSETLSSAMVKMTESRLGLVTVVDSKGAVAGVFTDGDLRRKLQADGYPLVRISAGI